ncbi:phosphoadenosine phosphosulfate reductase domain-containing protein [Herbaspirillum seropedicae]|uniref:phosphoadenosine phosphosulfate reductase domain-containing protein n=1 Tax=Herbaspirillum seropedicae TaxID=964 RepID=UPI002866F835|nr:phosphoadenosine phosphosulfate reductase family protein [Herbaspirillum seropedicae]MDR6397981.1 3'-phosphoadenosine 5'-phosphosulfate sulfotransferase (PAPS reductase)/FAD synthetase [Herbaspirillum seropedicae]
MTQLIPSNLPSIQALIARGALFVVNHSGGKDSQAMYLKLRDLVPVQQLLIGHADLGEVEWAGAVDHIRKTTNGERIEICKARRSLLEMIDERGMFPSPEQRQCTSDLKRGPIERTIRRIVEERVAEFIGAPTSTGTLRMHGRAAAMEAGCGLIVNCMGMRAQESSGRKKLPMLKFSARNSKAGREWYDWLPIHAMLEDEVFSTIAAAGQVPHIVYSLGMRRFSCVFCIMASEGDLKTAARLATEQPELLNDPHLFRKYVGLEKKHNVVMLMPSKSKGRRTLEEVTGILAGTSAYTGGIAA